MSGLQFDRAPHRHPTPTRAPRRDPGGPRVRQVLHRPHGHAPPGRRTPAGTTPGSCPTGRSRSTRRPPSCTTRRRSSRASRPTGTPTARSGRSGRRRTASGWPRSARAARAAGAARRGLPRRASSLLVRTDLDWVPSGGEQSLYLRPFMFASEAFLGVRPAHEVTLPRHRLARSARTSPAASSRCRSGCRRTTPGRRSAAPARPSAAATTPPAWPPMLEAGAHGCDQVCFLDAVERRWVEELGGMNLYFVHRRRPAGHPRAHRHDPRGRHPVVDPDPRQGARPGRRGAPGRRSTSGATASSPARSPRSSPAGRPRSSRRSAGSLGRRRGRHADHRRPGEVDRPAAAGAGRHPVRPRRGHPRLAAPARLRFTPLPEVPPSTARTAGPRASAGRRKAWFTTTERWTMGSMTATEDRPPAGRSADGGGPGGVPR